MNEQKSLLQLQRERRDCKNRVAPSFWQSLANRPIVAAMVGIVIFMIWEAITDRSYTRKCFFSDTYGNVSPCGPLDLLR